MNLLVTLTTNIVFLFLFSIFVAVPAEAWQVGRIKGKANLIQDKLKSPLLKGQELKVGDLVATEKRSRVLLKEGGSQIWVGSGSKFRIKNRAEKTTEKKESGLSFSLLYGKVRASIDKPTAKKYTFGTRSAVAGVRGTEFFFASDDVNDLFCTLEGSIDVESNGIHVRVNEGKGLELSSHAKPHLADNASALVDLWVAQTSFEDTSIDTSAYPVKQRHHQSAAAEITYGGMAWYYWCQDNNVKFGQWATSDTKQSCSRTVLSPFLQYGKGNRLFFRPAIYSVSNDFDSTLDTVPARTGTQITALTVAELYGATELWGWEFKLGLQDVEWADGVLLSRHNWTNEPKTHLALTVKGRWRGWGVEFLGGPGVEDSEPLEGRTHIKTLGLKLDVPGALGSVYALHANFGELETGNSAYVHGHEVNNIGLYLHNKKPKWDYSFSGIHQDHAVHHNAAGALAEAEGQMLDVSLGTYFGKATPMRFSIRKIHASKNFIPILDDYYKLGASGIVSTRANVDQSRVKFEMEPLEEHFFHLEYLMHTEVSSSGFVRHLSATSDLAAIGTEINLIYRVKWPPKWNLMLGYWEFDPSEHQSGTKKATGYLARLAYTY